MTHAGDGLSAMFSMPIAVPGVVQSIIRAGAASYPHHGVLQFSGVDPIAIAALIATGLVAAMGSFWLAGAALREHRTVRQVVPGTWWLR